MLRYDSSTAGIFTCSFGFQQLSVDGIVLPAVHVGGPFGGGFEFFPVGAAVQEHLLGGHGPLSVNGVDLVKIAGHVLGQAHHPKPVFRRNPVLGAQVFFDVGPDLRIVPVPESRHGGGQSSGNILQMLAHLVKVAGKGVLGSIDGHPVGHDHVVSEFRLRVQTGRLSQLRHRFRDHGHPGQLFPHMGNLVHPVILGDQGRRPGDDFELADHLAGAEKAVVTGEGIGEMAAELPFAAHEHPLPGHKHVVKNNQALRGLELARLGVIKFAFFPVCPRHRLHGEKLDPGGIQRGGEGQGVILVFFAMGPAGEAERFVGAGGGADMHLGPPHHDAVFPSVDDSQVIVPVLLLF